MIKAVSKVVVPVDDQGAAKDFWTGCAGFAATRDETYGDERWIEVTPPGGGPVLVLSVRPRELSRPEVPDMLPHSPVFFTCDDIEVTYEELRERGVVFTARRRACTSGGGRCSATTRGRGTHSGSGDGPRIDERAFFRVTHGGPADQARRSGAPERQRSFDCQRATVAPDGGAMAARHPVGPSRGSRTVVAPRRLAASTAAMISGTRP